MSEDKRISRTSFYTRNRANHGVVMYLEDPATGAKTNEWLRVLGMESDAFNAAAIEQSRSKLEIAKIEDKEAREKAEKAANLRTVASLVSGWSWDDKCTIDGVVDLLENAPQVKRQVEEVAFDRHRFYGSESSS